MKQFYVLFGSFLFAAIFTTGIGHTLSNVWAGGYPVQEEQQLEPLTVVRSTDLTIQRPVLVGETYFNGQLQSVQQVGSTLYLPTVNRAVDLRPGEEPLTFYGSTILFNPNDGSARTIDFSRDGYQAVMPGEGNLMPGEGNLMPGEGNLLPLQ